MICIIFFLGDGLFPWFLLAELRGFKILHAARADN